MHFVSAPIVESTVVAKLPNQRLIREIGRYMGLALLFTCDIVQAQPQTRVHDVLVYSKDVKETIRKSGQTSRESSRIRGVLMGDPTTPNLTPEFMVHAGSSQDVGYCVEISRANNLYSATFRFNRKRDADVYRVRFQSGHWSALQPVTAGELSISVRPTVNGRCEGPLLPARWGNDPQLSEIGWVLYNGGQSAFARIQVGQQTAQPCRPLAGDVLPRRVQGVQFNYFCPIAITLKSAECNPDRKVYVQPETGAASDGWDEASVRLVCTER